MEKKVGAGVGVIILSDDNKILLGLRTNHDAKILDKLNQTNTWTMPGGRIEFGESFEECAARETKEETNLDIDINDLEFVCVQNDKDEKAHYVTIEMKAKKYSGQLKTMEPTKICDWKWFDLDNLPKNMYAPSRKAVERYQSGLVYKED